MVSLPIMNDGEPLPRDFTNTLLHENFGSIDGGCMLSKPDMKTYEDLLLYVKDFDPRKFNTKLGDDELVLLSFYHSRNVLIN